MDTERKDPMPPPGISPAAAPKPAGNGHAEPQPHEVKIKFPPYNPLLLRAQGRRIRLPHDRSADMAEIGDLSQLATYAQQCAAVAAIDVTNAATVVQLQHLEGRLQALGAGCDRAIVQAINEYRQWQWDQVWYRRGWRWIRSRGRNSTPEIAP